MLLVIAIIYVVYQLIKSAAQDERMRQICQSRGYDTYWSNTGERDIATNKLCYKDPATGKKIWL